MLRKEAILNDFKEISKFTKKNLNLAWPFKRNASLITVLKDKIQKIKGKTNEKRISEIWKKLEKIL